MPATKSIIIFVWLITFSSLAQSQTLEKEVDSLYQISVNSEDPVVLRALITKSRQWLDRARVAQNGDHVSKAYLSLSRAYFLLGDEAEALKLYKLYMIESNQQALDSLNSLTSRKMQTYEHEVKALIKVQDDLETENSELKAEKDELFTKNTYIYYGLMALAVLSAILILVWFRTNSTNRSEASTVLEEEDDNEDSQLDLESINDQLSGMIDEMDEGQLDTITGLSSHFILNLPLKQAGGDGFWIWHNEEFSVFALFSAPMTGTPGFLFNQLVRHSLDDLVANQGLRAPSLLLTQLELKLKENQLNDIPDNGLSIGLASFDTKNELVDYAAAQMSMFVQQESEVSHFSGDTHPLLSSARQKGYFSTERVDLKMATKLIFNTDGLAQQIGGKELKPFGAKSVKNAVQEMINQPFSEQSAIIEKLHLSWRGGLAQTDDILMVGMEF